ncbi:MAG: hypothetical protein LBO09_00240 [Candidatus Peribacteria bacterium]|jgi:hypothetical protein|nr:hypothetical protein [Candidatus Peribacteria bacterium]
MDPLQQTAPQTPISSNATLSALTGILFFGPFVQRSMLSPEKGVAEGGGGSEANFIQGYCKVGKLNIVLFLITLSVYLINYFLQTAFLQRISSLTSLAICIISTFCIVACLNEIALQEIMPGV